MLGSIWAMSDVEFAFFLLFTGLLVSIIIYLVACGLLSKLNNKDKKFKR
ncbi:MAG: hypothetical protein ACP5NE_03505 [Candidatus Micrarchaeia archaeon]